MKRLLLLLGALVIAVAIGIGIERYPAVIVIVFGDWRVDIPFWVGIFLFIVFYLVLHIAIELVRSIWRVARSLAHFRQHYRQHRAKALIQRGLIAFTEGQYVVAEKTLEQGAQYSENAWLAYFSAAKAAQALDEEERAEQYLARVRALAPEADVAVALLQAQYYCSTKQYAKATTLLQAWHEKKPHHVFILKKLWEAHYAQQHWEVLCDLLPIIKKNGVFSKEVNSALEREVWAKRFSAELSLPKSEMLWKIMPHYLQTDKKIALFYAKILIRHQANEEAEKVLRLAIKQEWDEALIRCYGILSHPHPDKLLSTAEGWIADHSQSANLFLTLGRLSVQAQLWGKAQRYFEASLSLAPEKATYAALASLFEKLNKSDLSVQYFKKAALL